MSTIHIFSLLSIVAARGIQDSVADAVVSGSCVAESGFVNCETQDTQFLLGLEPDEGAAIGLMQLHSAITSEQMSARRLSRDKQEAEEDLVKFKEEASTPYMIGSSSSNACPVGSAAITSEADCKAAAKAMSYTWMYDEDSTNYPGGCYLYKVDSTNDILNGVYHNTNSGKGNSETQLICQPTAAQTEAQHRSQVEKKATLVQASQGPFDAVRKWFSNAGAEKKVKEKKLADSKRAKAATTTVGLSDFVSRNMDPTTSTVGGATTAVTTTTHVLSTSPRSNVTPTPKRNSSATTTDASLLARFSPLTALMVNETEAMRV